MDTELTSSLTGSSELPQPGALSSRPIRAGVLCRHDPNDPDVLSGMPYHACAALRARGIELVDVSGRPAKAPRPEFLREIRNRTPVGTAVDRWRGFRNGCRRIGERLAEPWDYSRQLRLARRLSGPAQTIVDRSDVDLLFGLCISTLMYGLETDVPMVYASDTTARLVNDTYPCYATRSVDYRRACDEIERVALRKCRMFAPAAQCAADSAVQDYGMDAERVRVVEIGAHVVPASEALDVDVPTRERLELSIVAADPERKRLSFCVEVAEALQRRGWRVQLNYIGPEHPAAFERSVVNWIGRLRLGDADDRVKHRSVLARSHWMLLPSTAEAFGIAPCEAAHFGRPSAVSDVGGLPTVVHHGKTGLVMPIASDAEAYAEAIEATSADPEAYRGMSAAAKLRARTVLSWDVWAERMQKIFVEVLTGDCP